MLPQPCGSAAANVRYPHTSTGASAGSASSRQSVGDACATAAAVAVVQACSRQHVHARANISLSDDANFSDFGSGRPVACRRCEPRFRKMEGQLRARSTRKVSGAAEIIQGRHCQGSHASHSPASIAKSTRTDPITDITDAISFAHQVLDPITPRRGEKRDESVLETHCVPLHCTQRS